MTVIKIQILQLDTVHFIFELYTICTNTKADKTKIQKLFSIICNRPVKLHSCQERKNIDDKVRLLSN